MALLSSRAMETPSGAGPGTNETPPQKPAHVREFTLRAVIAGLLVAAVIGASYPYIVLKLGFGPNISVVAAFFGFLALGLVSKSYNRWENNLVQTAGTAAGQIAFLCWLLAGFDLLRAQPGSGFDVQLTKLQVFLWLSVAGMLGALLAVPLRKHYIEDEKLAFPDGIAAGETLILLDSAGPQAKKSATAMLAALGASALCMLATARGWITEVVAVGAALIPVPTGVGLSISLLNIGSGMIIGLRICASMFLGMLLSWAFAPGLLIKAGILHEGAKRGDVLLWVMWPSTGLLVAGGLTALFLKWKTLVRTFRTLRGSALQSGDFPLSWVLVGSLVLGTALVVIQKQFIGTPVWMSIVAILLSLPMMLVAMRVLGETNWGPISTMTNVMQALFSAIAPGDLRAGMISSGITGSVAAESEGLMQDFKAGHMIGSTPRVLTWMQLIAIPVGALALAWMYPSLVQTYGLGGDKGLSPPTSLRWVGFAMVLKDGFSKLDPSVLPALAIGAFLGVVFTVLEQNAKLRPYVPSPTGVGIGMLIPANATATILIGAVVAWVWEKLNPKNSSFYSIPVASGLIAGEALVAVILAIVYGVGWWSPPA